MLCGAFHFNCTTFSFNLYGVEAMKIKYKCELCNAPFQFAKTLEKHIETEHIETNKIDYFRKYLLKIPDEKYGKCLVCGEPLETNGSKFAFFYENGFRRHTHRKCSKPTKEHWILMFGEKAGLEKWNNYCKLQSKSNTYEYKKEKFGWTKEDFDNYNKSRAVTLNNQIAKYGEEEGTKRFNEYCQTQSYAGNKLEYFIEKYGEKEGTKKYNELNLKKALTLENFTRIYGEELGKIKYEDYTSKGHCFFSKISKELFDKIQQKIPNIKFKYADNEFGLYDTIEKKYNKYDFTDTEHKIIIEYNGEKFHAKSPDDKDFSNPFNQDLTAEEQCKLDENKKLCAERKGFKIYYIWNNDYLTDKDGIVEKCVNIIKENCSL